MIGIYKITSPSNKIYIGQSIDIEKRFTTYKSLGCKGQPRLFSSLKKYGVDKHLFEIIVECELSELNDNERFYQEIYNTLDNGLNCQYVKTNDKKYVHSNETKLKISKSNIGKKGRLGVKFSEEHKTKIGLSKIGKKRPDVSLRLSVINKLKVGDKNTFYGKKHSIESRLKISEAKKGKYKGENSAFSKIVLDLNTGVFYNSLTELSDLLNLSNNNLSRKLSGARKNNTSYIYA